MSEKILKRYKDNKSSSSSSSSSFSPEILEERNTARFPSYERYHSYRERLIERNGEQRYLNEGRIAQQPEIVITSELYPNLNETTKRYIKQTFLLPDDRLNIFLQDHEKNVKVLKESSIVHKSRKGIERLFSSERFVPSSLIKIKPLRNTFRNNKYMIIIYNNYLKIINLLNNKKNNEEEKRIIRDFKSDLNKLFERYNDKNLNINNIIDFIIDLNTLLTKTPLLAIEIIFQRYNNKTLYLIYNYKILIAISTIIGYILNYLINNLYIYKNLDLIKKNNNPYITYRLLFDIREEDNSNIAVFFTILFELYIFRIFGILDIELYDLNTKIIEYNKLIKFIVMSSLFFNYNNTPSSDKLDYYKDNINYIIERNNKTIRSSLIERNNKTIRSSLIDIPRIRGQ